MVPNIGPVEPHFSSQSVRMFFENMVRKIGLRTYPQKRPQFLPRKVSCYRQLHENTNGGGKNWPRFLTPVLLNTPSSLDRYTGIYFATLFTSLCEACASWKWYNDVSGKVPPGDLPAACEYQRNLDVCVSRGRERLVGVCVCLCVSVCVCVCLCESVCVCVWL